MPAMLARNSSFYLSPLIHVLPIDCLNSQVPNIQKRFMIDEKHPDMKVAVEASHEHRKNLQSSSSSTQLESVSLTDSVTENVTCATDAIIHNTNVFNPLPIF
jgi:hypothetical protein